MKTHATLLLTVLITSAAAHAAALRQGQFTRVINDVKKLPEAAPAQPAAVGDTIAGKTAVSTGPQSRAELKFGDGTITRLGANSIFSLEQGSRTVDLQQGTILLQVPKQMGGARVRTAAVTAAVTGTTIMVEYQPNGFIKVIVLEGSLDMFRNDKPSEFRTIAAGDIVIMKPDSSFVPEPVQVDLEQLKKSSKLLDEKEFGGGLGNQRQMQGAQQQQQQLKRDGQLLKTALVIPGQGTRVMLTADARQQLTRVIEARAGNPPGPGGPGPGPGPGNPGSQGGDNPGPDDDGPEPIRQPLIGGRAVIGSETTINTNPHLSTSFNGTFATGQGRLYSPDTDGFFGRYVFGRPTTRQAAGDAGPVSKVDQLLRSEAKWATFLVDDLDITGKPGVNSTQGSGSRNLILAALGDITLSDTDPTTSERDTGYWDVSTPSLGDEEIETPALDNLIFAAGNNIIWDSSFKLVGTTQNVLLYTQGQPGLPSSGSVTMTSDYAYGNVDLPGGSFSIQAAGDVTLGSNIGEATESPAEPGRDRVAVTPTPSSITARDVKLSSGGNMTIKDGYTIKASQNLHAIAAMNLNITSSAQLRRIAAGDTLSVLLEAVNGNLNLDGSAGTVGVDGSSIELKSGAGNVSINAATLTADALKVTTLSPNGQILIGNSTLNAALGMKLYAQGANGTVRFVANSTLNGPAIIAGNTVLVDNGVAVQVSQPNSLNIHSNNHRYNDGVNGNFTNGGVNLNFLDDATPGTGPRKRDFGSRPSY